MAASYKNSKIIGTGSTSTFATLYTTAVNTSAVVSTIAVCNTAANSAIFRIAIVNGTVTPTTVDYIAFDTAVAGNDTSFISVGITLSANQSIRISSSTSTVAFTCFYSEIT